MFQRQDIAAALFFVGLGLLAIGVLAISVWPTANVIAGFLGGVMMTLGLIWWQMLKRR